MTGLTAVTAAALLIAAPLQTAARTVPWPTCPPSTDHALVAYSVGVGLGPGFAHLVIYRDRHASLCRGRDFAPCDPPTQGGTLCWHTDRTTFEVSRRTMQALTILLERLGAARLGPPPPTPCCDRVWHSLAYKGTTVPDDGYPSTRAGARALRQAESILDRISFAYRGPA